MSLTCRKCGKKLNLLRDKSKTQVHLDCVNNKPIKQHWLVNSISSLKKLLKE